jgi:hypothetical protein
MADLGGSLIDAVQNAALLPPPLPLLRLRLRLRLRLSSWSSTGGSCTSWPLDLSKATAASISAGMI